MWENNEVRYEIGKAENRMKQGQEKALCRWTCVQYPMQRATY